MRDMYEDGTYLKNNPRWHEEDASWKAGHITRMLQSHGIVPVRICEVGCGSGELLNCLSRGIGAQAQLFGYDISPQAMAIAKQKEKPNLNFKLASVFDDAAATFDVIMAIDVIEHVEDYFGFLRRIRQKATYKIFHIPLDLSVQTVLRATPIMKERATVGHIQYFTKETALATLSDTGHEVVDYFYTSSYIDLPNRGWKATLAKVPRRLMYAVNQDFAARILGGFSLLVLAK